MTPYILAPEALQELWDYIAIAAENLDAADRVIDTLFAVFERLAAMPGLGPPAGRLDGPASPVTVLELLQIIGERRADSAGRREPVYAFRRETKPDITTALSAIIRSEGFTPLLWVLSRASAIDLRPDALQRVFAQFIGVCRRSSWPTFERGGLAEARVFSGN